MAVSGASVPVVGDCTLDTVRGRLLRGGQPVHLRPQAYRMLAYLIEHRGRLLSKRELIEASIAAWEEPGHRTVIFDASRTTSTPRSVLPPVPGESTQPLSQAYDHRAWSSDGRRLALRAGDLLAIYSFEAGSYRTATIAGGIVGWIPHTSLVLLHQGWARRFVLVDTDSWKMTHVDYPPFIPDGDVRFGLSADGRTLALVHTRYEGDIWLMTTDSDATSRNGNEDPTR